MESDIHLPGPRVPNQEQRQQQYFPSNRLRSRNRGSNLHEDATLPNWDSVCSTDCTDGGVTSANVGPNSCRCDIVIMDANRAHAAP